MRKFLPPLILAAAILTTSSNALADGRRGFDSSITAIPVQSVRIDVALSDDLAQRAEGLPNNLKNCSVNRRTFKNGFACDGYLGQRDLDALTAKMKKHATKSLAKKDISVSDEADLILKLTLVDAQNNRPTHRQVSRQIGLSFRSFSVGGAEFEGELFTKDGTSLGQVSYSYYDDFLDEFSQASGTWTDANIAIQRFSNHIAKDFAKKAN